MAGEKKVFFGWVERWAELLVARLDSGVFEGEAAELFESQMVVIWEFERAADGRNLGVSFFLNYVIKYVIIL